ncbi:MAG: ABC transporter ATP-binding protein, partial [Patescibacteria group bacterium]
IGELQNLVTDTEVNKTLVWAMVAVIAVKDLAETIISNIQGYYGDILAKKVQKYMSERYYAHLMSLPQEYFDNELTGKITSRLNRSVVQLSEFLKTMSNNFGTFLLSAFLSLGIVAFISWPIALILASLYPIFTYMTIRTSGRWMEYQGEINQNTDIGFGRFQEVISQVKVVKSFTRERSELGFFSRHMNKVLKTTYPQSKLWHIKDVERRTVLSVVMAITWVIAIYQALNGQLSLAETVMIIQFSALIRFPIFTISFLVENTQKAVSDSKDFFAAMDLEPAIKDRPGAKKLRVSKGHIVLGNVHFAYGDKPVLKGFSADIKSGSKVALIGESGEGKSTVTNLLLRLYEPSSGVIAVDNQDISKVTQSSLRDSIGMVFQDASLFSGTIEENITYGVTKYTDREVKAAAKAANAHEFITEFEDGYKTLIGERGLKLSGGQKQRLSIARAILKNAPILILDEATSSLDNKSELLVQEALERLMKGRTTIIIAHRLSTIQDVDEIITIQDGVAAEVGSPKELSKSGGVYSRLLEVQSAATAEERKQALAKYGIVS